MKRLIVVALVLGSVFVTTSSAFATTSSYVASTQSGALVGPTRGCRTMDTPPLGNKVGSFTANFGRLNDGQRLTRVTTQANGLQKSTRYDVYINLRFIDEVDTVGCNPLRIGGFKTSSRGQGSFTGSGLVAAGTPAIEVQFCRVSGDPIGSCSARITEYFSSPRVIVPTH